MNTASNYYEDPNRLETCQQLSQIRRQSNDYYSGFPQRSIKRAKSVKDAFPPSPFKDSLTPPHSKRRSFFNLRYKSGQRPNDRICDHRIALSFDSSDCESLPDLSDSSSSAESVQSAVTPTKSSTTNSFSFRFASALSSPSTPAQCSPVVTKVQELPQRPSIFEIPELVHKIIEYADVQNPVALREAPSVRRKPLSLQHATLLCNGNAEQAKMVMRESCKAHSQRAHSHNILHTCLLVNKLFNRVAKEILGTKVIFENDNKFSLFVNGNPSNFEAMKPQTMVLNKLVRTKQGSLDKIAEVIDYSALEFLEIFMSPRLCPSSSFLHPALKSFVVTASKVLNDSSLVLLSERCPNLEILDVRACEEVTDYGVYSIASRCHKLRSVNLGRKRKGNLITDHSVSKLVGNNPRLHTVGLAGCHISDRTIWQIAMTCGRSLERLSVNDCRYITNQSIPVVLKHDMFPKLSVLEIRFIENITDFDSIVTFKRRQSANGITVLIETCETLLYRLKACEKKFDSHISLVIFQDISDWANEKDEEEKSYLDLIRARRNTVRPSHKNA